jgi:hypothetical protein
MREANLEGVSTYHENAQQHKCPEKFWKTTPRCTTPDLRSCPQEIAAAPLARRLGEKTKAIRRHRQVNNPKIYDARKLQHKK